MTQVQDKKNRFVRVQLSQTKKYPRVSTFIFLLFLCFLQDKIDILKPCRQER